MGEPKQPTVTGKVLANRPKDHVAFLLHLAERSVLNVLKWRRSGRGEDGRMGAQPQHVLKLMAHVRAKLAEAKRRLATPWEEDVTELSHAAALMALERQNLAIMRWGEQLSHGQWLKTKRLKDGSPRLLIGYPDHDKMMGSLDAVLTIRELGAAIAAARREREGG
jgi:hypothetical protein